MIRQTAVRVKAVAHPLKHKLFVERPHFRRNKENVFYDDRLQSGKSSQPCWAKIQDRYLKKNMLAACETNDPRLADDGVFMFMALVIKQTAIPAAPT